MLVSCFLLLKCIYQIFPECSLVIKKNSLIFSLKCIQLNFLGTLVDIAQREKMPPICWEKHGKNDKFPIHFDGVPYIFLGNGDYQCHQRRDRNITKKQKCKETRKVLGRGIDHTQHIKTRKLSQPSKKLYFPVQFSVKKLYRFLEYKISKDTSWQRPSTSKKDKTSSTAAINYKSYIWWWSSRLFGICHKVSKTSFFWCFDLYFTYFCFIYYSSIKVKLVSSAFYIAHHITKT